jgi:hypothetical protein
MARLRMWIGIIVLLCLALTPSTSKARTLQSQQTQQSSQSQQSDSSSTTDKSKPNKQPANDAAKKVMTHRNPTIIRTALANASNHQPSRTVYRMGRRRNVVTAATAPVKTVGGRVRITAASESGSDSVSVASRSMKSSTLLQKRSMSSRTHPILEWPNVYDAAPAL